MKDYQELSKVDVNYHLHIAQNIAILPLKGLVICDPLWEKVSFGRKNYFEKRMKKDEFWPLRVNCVISLLAREAYLYTVTHITFPAGGIYICTQC